MQAAEMPKKSTKGNFMVVNSAGAWFLVEHRFGFFFCVVRVLVRVLVCVCVPRQNGYCVTL